MRLTSLPAVLALVVSASCQTTSAPSSSHAPSKEQVTQAKLHDTELQATYTSLQKSLSTQPLSHYVVLPHSTPFFSTKSAAQNAQDTPPPTLSAFVHSPKVQASSFVVLQDAGDVVEVGILPYNHTHVHCAAALPATYLHTLEVRLWIRKSSILPVLTNTYTKTFEDKTAYAFLPNTPLWLSHTTGNPQLTLAAHQFLQPIPSSELRDLKLALSYAQHDISPVDRNGDSLPPETILWLDRKPRSRISELVQDLRIIRQQQRFDSQTNMVALTSSCVHIAALTSRANSLKASHINNQRTPWTSSTLIDEQGKLHYWTPSTSDPTSPRTLFWPDGTPAGMTRSHISRFGELASDASQDPSLRCYTTALNIDLPLCLRSRR